MAKSTKSYEARMLEMEKKEQESLEKAKRYAAQKKELLKRKKAEESKKRTHRLCQIGGAVESVLGAPIEEEDIFNIYSTLFCMFADFFFSLVFFTICIIDQIIS